ncbi:hypothetical protein [Sphingobacterium spiritivorum]|uniref:hypothetical protein n=1 Tax=Sphingobacterium spiritivorum TaxID=258 RepID=UPI00191B1439|nr:hypothetical protein [Sphingobacterium spiritivorum]QQT26850.1 hypothetical protein I6J02_03005 [Sphingobacterium spiritivorum]
MEFKGTPGPWVAVGNTHFYDVKTSVLGSDLSVMVMLFDEKLNPSHFSDENKANALLISKAPEMLEMLNHVLALAQCGNIVEAYKIEELIKSATQI